MPLAALYYDENNSSYANFCSTSESSQGAADVIMNIATSTGSVPTCFSNATAFAVSALLKSNPNTSFCVDSAMDIHNLGMNGIADPSTFSCQANTLTGAASKSSVVNTADYSYTLPVEWQSTIQNTGGLQAMNLTKNFKMAIITKLFGDEN